MEYIKNKFLFALRHVWVWLRLRNVKKFIRINQPSKQTKQKHSIELDEQLKEYGFTRLDGESNHEFIDRIFPELFFKDCELALMLLVGYREPSSIAEWYRTVNKFILFVQAKLFFPGKHQLGALEVEHIKKYLETFKKKYPNFRQGNLTITL